MAVAPTVSSPAQTATQNHSPSSAAFQRELDRSPEDSFLRPVFTPFSGKSEMHEEGLAHRSGHGLVHTEPCRCRMLLTKNKWIRSVDNW